MTGRAKWLEALNPSHEVFDWKPFGGNEGAAVDFALKNWLLTPVEKFALAKAFEFRHDFDDLHPLLDALAGAQRTRFKLKIGFLTAEDFDGDWQFVANPPNMNTKLFAKLTKQGEAARAKKSK
jgi:hypothetical protein